MTQTEALAELLRVYEGSNGDATKALYERLEKHGPLGLIAVNLLRAQKNSSRAKVYRGGGYRSAAYDRKQWAMGNLARILQEHAASSGIEFGWAEDPEQPYHKQVLYIDLPTGQVSFHTDVRGEGPDYAGKWDGVRDVAADRILRWTARLMADAR